MNVAIDTDPGIDDALALFLALESPELSIKGITAVYGNVAVLQAVRNILSIIEVAPRGNSVQVAGGAMRPLRKTHQKKDPRIHGKDGLGNSGLTRSHTKRLKDRGMQVFFKDPGKLSLICLGPLTNLARFILDYPRLAKKIDKIIIMGGAVYVPGNVTPFAEFNMYCDPDAAKIVFNCGFPIIMVGLDATRKVILRDEDISDLDTSVPYLDFVKKIAAFYIKFYRKNRGAEGCFLHDPLAVAVAIDKNIAETVDVALDIRLDGKKRGQTFIKKGSAPNIRLCVNVDQGKFMRLFRSRVLSLRKA